ncbi:MAG: hypothetical protein QF921_07995 [Pseudomonadales bacterium]|jgi:hypothetical protein|nr:hypothetical protein [Pseudomonadales bacterium]MDP6471729.1 hypothetical protein [Pseudomonadales bacterium]MDP6971439.1 hypothetical protein [Pseudomonadales bacterium]|tara:strand:- start:434 stop:856 length:423 start_codon:yes stop_codon:yes gene_type:complete
MSLPFPSLDFFQALQQRTKDEAVAFEKLGYCDTTFGIRVGSELYSITFEIYECVEVAEGGDAENLDFVLDAQRELWCEMLASIQENDGADASHTINSLTHMGDIMSVEYEDPEGHDRFYRFMATIQAFLDEAKNLDVEIN